MNGNSGGKMKKLLVIMFIFITIGFSEILKISVTDESAEIPCANQIANINASEPLTATRDLSYLPGWPKRTSNNAQFSPVRGVALADFDNDGKLEIIRPTTTGQLYVWKYDGTLYPGWPKALNNGGQEAPAVADVDLDGDYEICVCTRGLTNGGKVYLFDENGNNKPGWPFTGPHNGNFGGSPCLADVNGDDTLEIIVAERNYPIGHLYVLRYDGTPFSSAWPCSLNHVPTATAAVADINLDGIKEIVYYSYSSIYVFQPDGRILAGWPQINPNGRSFSYQSAALADVNHDDTLEIVSAMHQNGGGVYVWRYNGTLLSGWPYNLSRWTYCPPTVADLYRNNDLKVICGVSGVVTGSCDALYGFDDNGSVLTGFPFISQGGEAAEGNITVADIDGNGDMEIIFSSNKMTSADTLGYLYACHNDGSLVSGWPFRTHGFTYMNGATVADVDGNDSMDIVAVSAEGSIMEVSIWEAGVPFNRNSWEWPTYHFDMARTGLYRSSISAIKETEATTIPANLRISPNPLRSGSNVNLTVVNAGNIRLDLYDITGKLITNMFNGYLIAGNHKFNLPLSLTNGIYFIHQTKNGVSFNHKLIIQK
jgi:hypothetical protein